MPVTGWAARRWGAKRVYLVSLVLFTLGSIACGLSNSLVALVVFRVLQGIGGGMIMPLAQLIMAQVAGPKRMGRVMGVVSMPAMLAPIFGPVDRWPDPAEPALVLDLLRERPDRRASPSCSAGGCCPTPTPARPGRSTGSGWRCCPRARRWGSTASASSAPAPRSAPPGCSCRSSLGVVLSGLFVLHALRIERPLLDVRLYKNRVFAGASLTTFGLGAALFGAMILVPLYYQTGTRLQRHRHRSAQRAAGHRRARRDADRRPNDRALRRWPDRDR